MISKEAISNALATNNSWTVGCPTYKGLDYWDSLEKWKLEKKITEAHILKKLKEIEYEEQENTGNNQFAVLVNSMVCREIACCNWQAAKPFAIFNSIFQKACGKARKNLYGKTDLTDLTKGLFKDGKSKPGFSRSSC